MKKVIDVQDVQDVQTLDVNAEQEVPKKKTRTKKVVADVEADVTAEKSEKSEKSEKVVKTPKKRTKKEAVLVVPEEVAGTRIEIEGTEFTPVDFVAEAAVVETVVETETVTEVKDAEVLPEGAIVKDITMADLMAAAAATTTDKVLSDRDQELADLLEKKRAGGVVTFKSIAIEHYKSGKSISEIAKLLGKRYQQIRQYIVQYNEKLEDEAYAKECNKQ